MNLPRIVRLTFPDDEILRGVLYCCLAYRLYSNFGFADLVCRVTAASHLDSGKYNFFHSNLEEFLIQFLDCLFSFNYFAVRRDCGGVIGVLGKHTSKVAFLDRFAVLSTSFFNGLPNFSFIESLRFGTRKLSK